MPVTSRFGPSSRPLRAVALLTAFSSIVWEPAAGTPAGNGYRQIIAFRIVAGVIAAGIALLSSPRRSTLALSWLALLLGIDLAFATCGVAIAHPARAWESTAI